MHYWSVSIMPTFRCVAPMSAAQEESGTQQEPVVVATVVATAVMAVVATTVMEVDWRANLGFTLSTCTSIL